MAAAKTYRLPPAFWYDHHVNRGCSQSATVLREAKRYVVVELDREAFDDLASDCRYYIETGEGGHFDEGLGGLVSSARATLKRLNADPLGEASVRRSYVLRNSDGGVTSFVAWSADEAIAFASSAFRRDDWTVA